MLLTALILVVLWLALVALVHEVRDDGYGHRPAPSSTRGWGGAALPSAPYRDFVDH